MMKKYLSMLMLGVTALVAATAAHAGAIDDAVKRGTLKVGMDPTYMPFEMTDQRGDAKHQHRKILFHHQVP